MVMKIMKKICDENQSDSKLYLRPYYIFITGKNSAVIEYIPDTISIHKIKKLNLSLLEFYKNYFKENFQQA
jgi:phosphatidylinositol kinase/protein kinase (PI-3  family)